MHKKRILIFCSNSRAGGGIIVSTSFIKYLSTHNSPYKFSLIVSKEVYDELINTNTELKKFDYIKVQSDTIFDFINPFKYYFFSKKFDLIFCIFGPPRFFFFPKVVSGFANPSFIYKENLSLFKNTNLYNQFLFYVSLFYLLQINVIIVEQDDAAERLKKIFNKLMLNNKIKILVVENQINSFLTENNNSQTLNIPTSNNTFKIGLVSRNYPHKYIKIFPEIKNILLKKYNFQVDMYVTFTEEEFNSCSLEFRSSIVNVGKISISQIPEFYRNMDAILLPTLLECSSATIPECFYYKKPLFLSDFIFNRIVASKYAFYINPLDTDNIANVIYEYFTTNNQKKEIHLNSAFKFISEKIKSSDRNIKYLEILKYEMLCSTVK